MIGFLSCYRSFIKFAVLVSAIVIGAGPFEAQAAVNILALGDSITYGSGDESTLSQGGYRGPLNTLLSGTSLDYRFIGNARSNFLDTTGIAHAGFPGAQTKSLSTAVSREGVVWDTGVTPDIVMLHAGTNSISEIAGSNNEVGQIVELLDLLDSSLGSNTLYFTAQILPRATNVLYNGSNFELLSPLVEQTAIYNSRITTALRGKSYASRVNFVDMYKTEVSNLALSPTELALINTENDISTYGAPGDYVDWIKELDESDLGVNFPDNPSSIWWNEYLLVDGIHPTVLGYEIMAQNWFRALTAARVIPEPTSLALMGIGSLVLLLRCRYALEERSR